MPRNTQTPLTEQERLLIEAFTNGEMAGFKHVYTLFRQQIFSYCLYYMGDKMLAEDAFQEVFIRIYTHRTQLREAKALKTWVLLITRSVCLNMLRISKFTPEFVSLNDSENSEIFEEALDGIALPIDYAIADDMLRMALAKIAPMYREAFLLCEFEGYDYNEIARITNTTEDNARVRITRAKKQLRELLAPHYRGKNVKERAKKPQKSFSIQENVRGVSYGPPDDFQEVFAQ